MNRSSWLCLLIGVLPILGCINPYRQHFVPSIESNYPPVERVDLRRLGPHDFERAAPDRGEELGRTDFAGSFAQPEQAKEFAAEIGANRVLLNIEYETTIPRTVQYPRAAFGVHHGFRERVGRCRFGHRYACNCGWDRVSYSPAYDYETIPVSVYRHRAIFLRDDAPRP